MFTKHRFGRREELPMEAGIGDATVGYFTCSKHDREFYPADQAVITTDVPPQQTLDLMAYRGILHARWWIQLWAQASERVGDEWGLERQRQIATMLRADDEKLLQTQLRLERNLSSSQDHQVSPIEHLVLTSEGQPVIGAARFGAGISGVDDRGEMELWGMTVVPSTTHNALCIHFDREMGTKAIDAALPSLLKGRTKFSGEEVTRAILSGCYDVVFSKETWNALMKQERDNVVQEFNPGIRDQRHGIDLFKGKEWTIL